MSEQRAIYGNERLRRLYCPGCDAYLASVTDGIVETFCACGLQVTIRIMRPSGLTAPQIQPRVILETTSRDGQGTPRGGRDA